MTRPLVSIIFPTRNRVPLLGPSVDSLVSLAQDPTRLEFLFKTDDDDPGSADWVRWARTQFPALQTNFRLFSSPRGRGYHDMHRWVNSLSRHATGTWVTIWNDDVRMLTQDWDDLIARTGTTPWHGCEEISGFVVPSEGRPDANEFIFLRREVLEVLGHWSFSPHNDNWAYRVMHQIQSMGKHPFVKVHHFSEQMTDDVRKESEEAYKTTAKDTLDSGWAMEQILHDSLTLLAYVKKQNKVQWDKGKDKV